jgi:hypothetical protein
MRSSSGPHFASLGVVVAPSHPLPFEFHEHLEPLGSSLRRCNYQSVRGIAGERALSSPPAWSGLGVDDTRTTANEPSGASHSVAGNFSSRPAPAEGGDALSTDQSAFSLLITTSTLPRISGLGQ